MSFETANRLLGLLANGVIFYAVKRFIGIFLPEEECRFRQIWILYVIAWGLTSLIHEMFQSPALNIFSNVAGFLLLVSPYRAKLSKKLLTVFMIYVVMALTDCVAVVTLTKYTVGEPVNQIYGCAMSLCLLLFAVVLERTISAQKDIHLPMFYRAALGLVPSVSIACIYYVVVTAVHLKMTTAVVAASLLIINILDFYLYDSLIKFYNGRMEKEMFEQMANVYAYQLEVVRESQERVTALRHDMKHHMIELSSMLSERDNPAAVKYLGDMVNFMLNPKEYVSTGNKEIDGILNYLLQKADETLSQIDVKVNVPENGHWTDFTICVILGNLVDNAVREAEKSNEKYLSIDIRSRRGILLIFIENSYFGEIKEEGRKFRTTQANPAIHGIGLENVKKIVRENGGEIKIAYANNRFRVEVLLYQPNVER